MATWRDHLKVHPAAELFPLMSKDEIEELGKDIKQNGLQQKIKIDCTKDKNRRLEYFVIDGRNRLDAMEAVGIKFLKDDGGRIDQYFEQIELDHADIIGYVISANIKRRHLTGEQKRTLIAELLKARPGRSNLQTAKIVGADDKTVASVRREMERRSEIPNVATTTDTKGRRQPTHKPPASVVAPPGPVSKPVHPLNSLSWSEASLDERRRFVSAVGLAHLYAAASPDLQRAFIDGMMREAAE